MFKKSRRKIVAAIMSVLSLVFIGTLCVIYIASYMEVTNDNYDMLFHHVETYSLYEHIKDIPSDWSLPMDEYPIISSPPPKNDRNDIEFSPEFKIATFYSVAVAYDGTFITADTAGNSIYEESQLKEYAYEVLEHDREKGHIENLLYTVSDKQGYTLVAFMDNRLIKESMGTLFIYTLVFGFVAMTAMFFLAMYLAKKIVEPLEESYKKQKQFISDAGHELKTPIAVVNANAEILQREIGENKWLANIRYENERLGLLSRQLLELAKTESVKPQKEQLNFSRLVTGEILPFESIAYENGLTLDSDIQPDIFADGNENQLKQLVSILIDNAIRHCESGNRVKATLTAAKNTLTLSVSNPGKELSKEQLEHLFERFYKIDEARSGNDKHYGLGLAIAKAIVSAHGGKIDVICKNGLIDFTVQLPIK